MEKFMSTNQISQLQTDLQNAQARRFRKDTTVAERQRLQEKIAWLKQRIVEMRRNNRAVRS